MNFEELYHAHKKMVYNLALQYVQHSEDAQEISQDVFVSIHQNLASFENRSKLSTWIYRITINKSLDFIKTKKRKKRFGFFTALFHEESGEIIHEAASFDHPGILMEHKEAFETLFKLINELPVNQRTALILSKIEQKPQSEVAEIMNLSVKAVESLIQRAKTNLTQKLKNNEGI
ncbi:MAG: RNA polymerase sigma factor [bacterium]|nr:RNA polymerase sigma factor [bacterium]